MNQAVTRPPPTCPPPPAPKNRHGKRKAALRLLLLAALLAAVAGIIHWQDWIAFEDAAAFAETVRGVTPTLTTLLLFLLVFVACSALGVPGFIFLLAGGAMFGFAIGTLVNWLGTVMGATASYLIGRSLGKEALRELLGRRVQRLDTLLEEHAFWAILRLRLLPLTPYNVLNYAAGITGTPARAYIGGTMLGTLPVVAVYTFFADSLLMTVGDEQQHTLLRISIALTLLMLLTLVPRPLQRLLAARACRRAGQNRKEHGQADTEGALLKGEETRHRDPR